MFLKSILPPSIPSWCPLSYSSRIISNLWVIKADRIIGLRGPVLAGHGGRAHPSLDSNVVRVQLAPAFIVVASWQWWQLICAPLIYGCIFHKVGKCELSSRFLIFLRLRFLRCTTQHTVSPAKLPNTRGPVNYARPLSTTLTCLWLEDRWLPRKEQEREEGLQRKTSDLPPTLRRLYSREPNEWCTME